MDAQKASVYLAETFDRLLRRAQYALMTGDVVGILLEFGVELNLN